MSGLEWNGLFEGCLLPLFFFPLLVQRPLVVGEQGIDLPVGLLQDGAAGMVIGAAVAGGIVSEAVHGDIAVDEDHLKLEDLVLGQMELFLEII